MKDLAFARGDTTGDSGKEIALIFNFNPGIHPPCRAAISKNQ
jgi:hypothetical protein